MTAPGQVGIGERLPWSQYALVGAVNMSTLKIGLTSMLHYRTALDEPPRDSDALRFGRMVHCSVFEPREFPKRYIVPDGLDEDPRANRGTKEGRAAWKAWQVEHGGAEMESADWKHVLLAERFPGREVVSEADYERALTIGEKLNAHRHARKYLAHARPEVTIRWVDPETKLPCKARIDGLIDDPLLDCDLKTAATIRFHPFRSAAWRFGYFHAFAFHRMGLQAITGKRAALRWLAIEKEPPFDCAVFEPDEDALYAAEEEIRPLLIKVVHGRKTGEWPGQYDQETTMTAPPWAWPEENATDDLMFGQGEG